MKMKKFVSTILVGTLALSLGIAAFANASETYSNLAGVTVEEAFEERGTDKTFGELAEEKGFLDEFTKAMLEEKKEWLDALVKDGRLTQEKADEILKDLENCTLDPGSRRGLIREYNLGFGRNTNRGLRDGSNLGRGYGRNSESKGLRDGSGFQRGYRNTSN